MHGAYIVWPGCPQKHTKCTTLCFPCFALLSLLSRTFLLLSLPFICFPLRSLALPCFPLICLAFHCFILLYLAFPCFLFAPMTPPLPLALLVSSSKYVTAVHFYHATANFQQATMSSRNNDNSSLFRGSGPASDILEIRVKRAKKTWDISESSLQRWAAPRDEFEHQPMMHASPCAHAYTHTRLNTFPHHI